ncbi:hypothetical protein CC86DRAFT_383285 [Ophiobolus disseminans]|uniref:RelA/SpoT domain-containing protein n=1 Tax=Ophiobolus disseminans TaxID=1469910 RepID=A0A6A6ZY17_9PLEO|nr:hypothetical protein CC86DRAFT_383285 [Ophiobolus disseminans]
MSSHSGNDIQTPSSLPSLPLNQETLSPRLDDGPDDEAETIRSAISALSKVKSLPALADAAIIVDNSHQLRETIQASITALTGYKHVGRSGSGCSTSKSQTETGREHVSKDATKAADAFMEIYQKEKEDWSVLSKFVKKECEEILKNEGVQARCSKRVKEEGSLREKLEKKQKSGLCLDADAIQKELWDIAGVRICLYFPSHASTVRDIISNHKNFEIIPQQRYRYIPAREPPPAGGDWLCKPFREHSYTPRNQQELPYEERMGYYDADHYWIKLQGEDLLREHPGWEGKRIEIQVRSVVMDAWAEVRHDLEYKNIIQGYPGEDELRTLDSIKGSIATCEILLDSLRKLQEDRIASDNVKFSFPPSPKELGGFTDAVLLTLRSKHRQLLDIFQYGHSKNDNPYGIYALGKLMEAFGISTPASLREAIMELKSEDVIVDLLETIRTSRPEIFIPDLYPGYSKGTRIPPLFDFLFLYFLDKPGRHVDRSPESSYKFGMYVLQRMERYIFRMLDSCWQHGYGLPNEDDDPWFPPLPSNSSLVESFSTVWYLTAYFDRTPSDDLWSIPWEIDGHGIDPLHCILAIWKYHLQELVASAFFWAAGGWDKPQYVMYDPLGEADFVTEVWRHPGWMKGIDNACRILESDRSHISTAGLWQVLKTPNVKLELATICLSWPEVNLWERWQNCKPVMPVIAQAFRTIPFSTVAHVLRNLGPSWINSQPGHSAPMLHYAVRFCNYKIVDVLLHHGADVNATTRGSNIPLLSVDYNNYLDREVTPLELARLLGETESIKLLEAHINKSTLKASSERKRARPKARR